MRTFLCVVFLGLAATFVQAQDQPKPPAKDQPQLDKDTETRIRTERSAGGLGKVTPEERANANVGAGPHQRFKNYPAPRDKEEKAETAPERDASRGATR